jgi:hypothetical protein
VNWEELRMSISFKTGPECGVSDAHKYVITVETDTKRYFREGLNEIR